MKDDALAMQYDLKISKIEDCLNLDKMMRQDSYSRPYLVETYALMIMISTWVG